MLEINGLNKSFGDKEILKDINLHLTKGEIVGLLGKNGAGKTTLIKAINHLYNYTGEVKINGKLYKDNPKEYLQSVGVLLEPSYYDYLTAMENMKMICSFNKECDPSKKAMELLEFIGLQDACNKKVGSFSFGMKQRLGVAMALSNDPELLILDEPTIGVDPKGLEILKNRLVYLAKEKKKTILFSSNNLNEVEELSERIILLKDGSILQDRDKESVLKEGNQYTIVVMEKINDIDLNIFENELGCTVQDLNTIKISNNENLDLVLERIILSKNKIIDISKCNLILQNFYN